MGSARISLPLNAGFSEAPLGSPLSLLDFVSYEAAISDLNGPRRQPANLRTIGGSLKAKLANCIFTLLGNDSRLLQPGTSSIHYGPTRLHLSNSKLRDDDESIAWIKWAFNVDICSGGGLEFGSLPTFWLLVYAKCFQVRSHVARLPISLPPPLCPTNVLIRHPVPSPLLHQFPFVFFKPERVSYASCIIQNQA